MIKRQAGHIFTGLSVLVFMVSASLYARSNSAIQAFNKGVQKFNASQFSEAIPLFDQAIEHDSEFAEAYYARAVCKQNMQNPQGALSDLNQTIQLKKDYLDAYALRAVIWYGQEQWDPALQDFDHVLQSRPNDPQSLLGRGIISLRQHHIQTAQHDLRLYIKLRPDDPLAPKIRRLLASFSKEPAGEEPSQGRSVGSRPMSAESEKLAQDLFSSSHEVSDTYGRKVMRGERAEAIGDIQTLQSRSKPKSADGNVQIVEPR